MIRKAVRNLGRLSRFLLRKAGSVLLLFPRLGWLVLPLRMKTEFLEFALRHTVGYLDYPRRGKRIAIEVVSAIIMGRLRSSSKEPATIRWIEDTIKPGDVFYDIGANIGAYSFVACLHTSGRSRIYAFEPGFSTFPQLCRNIILNSFQSEILPLNIALSSQTGASDFAYQDVAAGAAEHRGLEREDKTSQHKGQSGFVQRMPVYSMDDAIELLKLDLPNHIKIDADGHEFSILLGGQRTLKSPNLTSIQVEIDESTDQKDAIIRWLADRGFAVHRISRHQEGPICDYVFIRGNE